MTDPEPRLELAQRAVRDLRKMNGPQRRRVRDALEALAASAENLDVKALVGRAPWLRLRVGDSRVLYRPLSDEEAAAGGPGWLVARVVDRRDLERSVRSLGA
jgi:mRNA-degrading endonuclease RelE of RelBE toxin-antitoxin system